MGLLIPLKNQIGQARKKYHRLRGKVVLKAASPYALTDEVANAAEALKREDPQVIVMHCMGYTQGDEEEGDGDYRETYSLPGHWWQGQ